MNTVPHSAQDDNTQMYTVYVLIDPRDFLPRYVGFTQDIQVRMQNHRTSHKGCNPEKDSWLEELDTNHLEPIVQSLEVVSDTHQARQREIFWIRHFSEKGITLLNILIAKTPYKSFPPISQQQFFSDHSQERPTYQLQYRRCNKPQCSTCRNGAGHGPYWYAFWHEGKRLRSRYIGKDKPADSCGK